MIGMQQCSICNVNETTVDIDLNASYTKGKAKEFAN